MAVIDAAQNVITVANAGDGLRQILQTTLQTLVGNAEPSASGERFGNDGAGAVGAGAGTNESVGH